MNEKLIFKLSDRTIKAEIEERPHEILMAVECDRIIPDDNGEIAGKFKEVLEGHIKKYDSDPRPIHWRMENINWWVFGDSESSFFVYPGIGKQDCTAQEIEMYRRMAP